MKTELKSGTTEAHVTPKSNNESIGLIQHLMIKGDGLELSFLPNHLNNGFCDIMLVKDNHIKNMKTLNISLLSHCTQQVVTQ